MSFGRVLTFIQSLFAAQTMEPEIVECSGFGWYSIGQLVVWFWNFICEGLYFMIKWLLAVVDFMQYFIQKLIGLDYWLKPGGKTLQGATDNDLLFQFLYNDTVQDVFRAMVGVFILLLVIFVIFSIVKSEWKYATGDGKSGNSKIQIFRDSFKAFLLVLVFPLVLTLGIISSNAILASLVGALNLNMSSTFGGTLFSIAAEQGNKYRVYANSGKKAPVSQQVTFYVDNQLKKVVLFSNGTTHSDTDKCEYISDYGEYLERIYGKTSVGAPRCTKYTVDTVFDIVVPSESTNFSGYCVGLKVDGSTKFFLVRCTYAEKEGMYYYLNNVLGGKILSKNTAINANQGLTGGTVESLWKDLKGDMESFGTQSFISGINLNSFGPGAVITAAYNTWGASSIYMETTEFDMAQSFQMVYSDILSKMGISGTSNAKLSFNSDETSPYFDNGQFGFVGKQAEYRVMADVIDFISNNTADLYIVDATSSSIKWEHGSYFPESRWITGETLTDGENAGKKGVNLVTVANGYNSIAASSTVLNDKKEEVLPFVVAYSDLGNDVDMGNQLYMAHYNTSSELEGAVYLMCWKVIEDGQTKYVPLVNGKSWFDEDRQITMKFKSEFLANNYRGVIVAKGFLEGTGHGRPTYINSGLSRANSTGSLLGSFGTDIENYVQNIKLDAPHYYKLEKNSQIYQYAENLIALNTGLLKDPEDNSIDGAAIPYSVTSMAIEGVSGSLYNSVTPDTNEVAYYFVNDSGQEITMTDNSVENLTINLRNNLNNTSTTASYAGVKFEKDDGTAFNDDDKFLFVTSAGGYFVVGANIGKNSKIYIHEITGVDDAGTINASTGASSLGDAKSRTLDVKSGPSTAEFKTVSFTVDLAAYYVAKDGTKIKTTVTPNVSLDLFEITNSKLGSAEDKSVFRTVDMQYIEIKDGDDMLFSQSMYMNLSFYTNRESLFSYSNGLKIAKPIEVERDAGEQVTNSANVQSTIFFDINYYSYLSGYISGENKIVKYDIYNSSNNINDLIKDTTPIDTAMFGVNAANFNWGKDEISYDLYDGDRYVATIYKLETDDDITNIELLPTVTTTLLYDYKSYENIQTRNTHANREAFLNYSKNLKKQVIVGFYRDELAPNSFGRFAFDFNIPFPDLWNMRLKLISNLFDVSKDIRVNKVFISDSLAFDYFFDGDSINAIALSTFYDPAKVSSPISVGFWIMIIAGALIIKILGTALWGIIKRFYEITLYYIAMPAVASTIVLDSGTRFKSSIQDPLIGKVLSTYGVILGINAFFVLLAPVRSMSNIFTAADIATSGSYFLKALSNLPFFGSDELTAKMLNSYTYILFLLVAFTMIDELPKVITQIMGVKGADNVLDSGEKTKKNVQKTMKEAGEVASGKALLDAKDKALQTAGGMIPGAAFVTAALDAKKQRDLKKQQKEGKGGGGGSKKREGDDESTDETSVADGSDEYIDDEGADRLDTEEGGLEDAITGEGGPLGEEGLGGLMEGEGSDMLGAMVGDMEGGDAVAALMAGGGDDLLAEGASAIADGGLDALADGGMDAFADIAGEGMGDLLGEGAGELLGEAGGGVGAAVAVGLDVVGEVGGAVAKGVGDVVSNVAGSVTNAVSSVTNGMTNAVSSVTDGMATNMAGGIGDAFDADKVAKYNEINDAISDERSSIMADKWLQNESMLGNDANLLAQARKDLADTNPMNWGAGFLGRKGLTSGSSDAEILSALSEGNSRHQYTNQAARRLASEQMKEINPQLEAKRQSMMAAAGVSDDMPMKAVDKGFFNDLAAIENMDKQETAAGGYRELHKDRDYEALGLANEYGNAASSEKQEDYDKARYLDARERVAKYDHDSAEQQHNERVARIAELEDKGFENRSIDENKELADLQAQETSYGWDERAYQEDLQEIKNFERGYNGGQAVTTAGTTARTNITEQDRINAIRDDINDQSGMAFIAAQYGISAESSDQEITNFLHNHPDAFGQSKADHLDKRLSNRLNMGTGIVAANGGTVDTTVSAAADTNDVSGNAANNTENAPKANNVENADNAPKANNAENADNAPKANNAENANTAATAQNAENTEKADQTLADNNAKIDANNAKIDENNGTIDANNAKIDENKSTIDANNAKIDENKSTIDANNAKIDENNGTIEANKGKMEENDATIAENDKEIAKNNKEIASNETKISKKEDEIKQLEAANAGLDPEADADKIAANQVKIDAKKAEIGDLKEENQAFEEDTAQRTQQNTTLEGENTQLGDQNTTLEAENVQMEEQNATLQKDNEARLAENKKYEEENLKVLGDASDTVAETDNKEVEANNAAIAENNELIKVGEEEIAAKGKEVFDSSDKIDQLVASGELDGSKVVQADWSGGKSVNAVTDAAEAEKLGVMSAADVKVAKETVDARKEDIVELKNENTALETANENAVADPNAELSEGDKELLGTVGSKESNIDYLNKEMDETSKTIDRYKSTNGKIEKNFENGNKVVEAMLKSGEVDESQIEYHTFNGQQIASLKNGAVNKNGVKLIDDNGRLTDAGTDANDKARELAGVGENEGAYIKSSVAAKEIQRYDGHQSIISREETQLKALEESKTAMAGASNAIEVQEAANNVKIAENNSHRTALMNVALGGDELVRAALEQGGIDESQVAYVDFDGQQIATLKDGAVDKDGNRIVGKDGSNTGALDEFRKKYGKDTTYGGIGVVKESLLRKDLEDYNNYGAENDQLRENNAGLARLKSNNNAVAETSARLNGEKAENADALKLTSNVGGITGTDLAATGGSTSTTVTHRLSGVKPQVIGNQTVPGGATGGATGGASNSPTFNINNGWGDAKANESGFALANDARVQAIMQNAAESNKNWNGHFEMAGSGVIKEDIFGKALESQDTNQNWWNDSSYGSYLKNLDNVVNYDVEGARGRADIARGRVQEIEQDIAKNGDPTGYKAASLQQANEDLRHYESSEQSYQHALGKMFEYEASVGGQYSNITKSSGLNYSDDGSGIKADASDLAEGYVSAQELLDKKDFGKTQEYLNNSRDQLFESTRTIHGLVASGAIGADQVKRVQTNTGAFAFAVDDNAVDKDGVKLAEKYKDRGVMSLSQAKTSVAILNDVDTAYKNAENMPSHVLRDQKSGVAIGLAELKNGGRPTDYKATAVPTSTRTQTKPTAGTNAGGVTTNVTTPQVKETAGSSTSASAARLNSVAGANGPRYEVNGRDADVAKRAYNADAVNATSRADKFVAFANVIRNQSATNVGRAVGLKAINAQLGGIQNAQLSEQTKEALIVSSFNAVRRKAYEAADEETKKQMLKDYDVAGAVDEKGNISFAVSKGGVQTGVASVDATNKAFEEIMTSDQVSAESINKAISSTGNQKRIATVLSLNAALGVDYSKVASGDITSLQDENIVSMVSSNKKYDGVVAEAMLAHIVGNKDKNPKQFEQFKRDFGIFDEEQLKDPATHERVIDQISRLRHADGANMINTMDTKAFAPELANTMRSQAQAGKLTITAWDMASKETQQDQTENVQAIRAGVIREDLAAAEKRMSIKAVQENEANAMINALASTDVDNKSYLVGKMVGALSTTDAKKLEGLDDNAKLAAIAKLDSGAQNAALGALKDNMDSEAYSSMLHATASKGMLGISAEDRAKLQAQTAKLGIDANKLSYFDVQQRLSGGTTKSIASAVEKEAASERDATKLVESQGHLVSQEQIQKEIAENSANQATASAFANAYAGKINLVDSDEEAEIRRQEAIKVVKGKVEGIDDKSSMKDIEAAIDGDVLLQAQVYMAGNSAVNLLNKQRLASGMAVKNDIYAKHIMSDPIIYHQAKKRFRQENHGKELDEVDSMTRNSYLTTNFKSSINPARLIMVEAEANAALDNIKVTKETDIEKLDRQIISQMSTSQFTELNNEAKRENYGDEVAGINAVKASILQKNSKDLAPAVNPATMGTQEKAQYDFTRNLLQQMTRGGNNSEILVNAYNNTNLFNKGQIDKEIDERFKQLLAKAGKKAEGNEAMQAKLKAQATIETLNTHEDYKETLITYAAADVTRTMDENTKNAKYADIAKSSKSLDAMVVKQLGTRENNAENYKAAMNELLNSNEQFKNSMYGKLTASLNPNNANISETERNALFDQNAYATGGKSDKTAIKNLDQWLSTYAASGGKETGNVLLSSKKKLPGKSAAYDNWNKFIDKKVADIKGKKGEYANMSVEQRKAEVAKLEKQYIGRADTESMSNDELETYLDQQSKNKEMAFKVGDFTKLYKKNGKVGKVKSADVLNVITKNGLDAHSGFNVLTGKRQKDDDSEKAIVQKQHMDDYQTAENNLTKFKATAAMRTSSTMLNQQSFEATAKNYGVKAASVDKQAKAEMTKKYGKKVDYANLTTDQQSDFAKFREQAMQAKLLKKKQVAAKKVANDSKDESYSVSHGIRETEIRYRAKKFNEQESVVSKTGKKARSGEAKITKIQQNYGQAQNNFNAVAEFNRQFKGSAREYKAQFKAMFGENSAQSKALDKIYSQKGLNANLDKKSASIQMREVMKHFEAELNKAEKRMMYKSKYIPANARPYVGETLRSAAGKRERALQHNTLEDYSDAMKHMSSSKQNKKSFDDAFAGLSTAMRAKLFEGMTEKGKQDFHKMDDGKKYEFVQKKLEIGHNKAENVIKKNNFFGYDNDVYLKLNGVAVKRTKEDKETKEFIKKLPKEKAIEYKQYTAEQERIVKNITKCSKAFQEARTKQETASPSDKVKLEKEMGNYVKFMKQYQEELEVVTKKKKDIVNEVSQNVHAGDVRKGLGITRGNGQSAFKDYNVMYRPEPGMPLQPVREGSPQERAMNLAASRFILRHRTQLQNMCKTDLYKDVQTIDRYTKQQLDKLSNDFGRVVGSVKNFQEYIKGRIKELEAENKSANAEVIKKLTSEIERSKASENQLKKDLSTTGIQLSGISKKVTAQSSVKPKK